MFVRKLANSFLSFSPCRHTYWNKSWEFWVQRSEAWNSWSESWDESQWATWERVFNTHKRQACSRQQGFSIQNPEYSWSQMWREKVECRSQRVLLRAKRQDAHRKLTNHNVITLTISLFRTENKVSQNRKVTDYYPIRRSNRKTKSELKVCMKKTKHFPAINTCSFCTCKTESLTQTVDRMKNIGSLMTW